MRHRLQILRQWRYEHATPGNAVLWGAVGFAVWAFGAAWGAW